MSGFDPGYTGGGGGDNPFLNNPPSSQPSPFVDTSGGNPIDPSNPNSPWYPGNNQGTQFYDPNNPSGINSNDGGGGGGIPLGGKSATALSTAQFLLNLYKATQKGKFQNVPLSPEQQALFNFSFSRLVNSPNPAHDLYGYALQRAYTQPSFDMNAAMQGRPAYSPGQTPDLATLMAMINANNATMNPSTTNSTTNSPTTPADTGGGSPGGLAHSRFGGGAAR